METNNRYIDNQLVFPPKDQLVRIQNYEFYEKLFVGEHFEGFNVVSTDFNRDYSALRYVTANFAGLISKLSADMLFEEFPQISLPEGDEAFLNEFILQNRLKAQLYESGLEQSYNGDVVLRIRAENGQVIMEDINPAFYFPEINEDNVRAEPKAHVLAWKVKLAGNNQQGRQRYAIFKEKHYRGKIVNTLEEIDDQGKIIGVLDVGAYLTDAKGQPLPQEIPTNINEFLIIHIPNYRTNTRYFGISDYKDLTSLMFGVNNRVTKIDNILDKHGDPILAVPQGVLDEDGRVKREAFGVIEVDSMEGQGMLPQYIVWDAKLESAFDEIDKLVEFLFLFSDTAKAMFGLDKEGMAESGRALKYRLLRTLAKKHRKELYYDIGLKEAFYTVQLFAKANKLKTGELTLKKEPVKPSIKWLDGIINDAVEQLDIQERRVEAGFSTHPQAIAELDGISEAEALKKYQEIQKEKEENMPVFSGNPVVKGTPPTNTPPVDKNGKPVAVPPKK